MGSCDGRVALITGSSRGIGRATAMRFAAEGASVVLSASRLGSHGSLVGTLEEAVSDVQAAGGKAAAIAADLRDPEARTDIVERASEHFGPVDILVNNAASSVMKLPSEVTSEERSMMFEVNVNAPMDLSQQALPWMRAKGEGWILNITSATSTQPTLPYRAGKTAAHIIGSYGASKAALDRLTQALAHEVSDDGIFVNAMAPLSIVLTQGASYVRDIARANPDWVEPVEMMAEAALELCTGRHVGRVIFSRDILHQVNRPVRSLDGREIIGDAFTLADPEATA